MWLRWFSWLPLPILYWLADLFSWVVFYLVRYRRQVVVANLTRSFPDKSAQEIRRLSRSVYHNIADIFVETIKAYRLSPAAISKRVTFKNIDVLDQFIKQQQPFIILATHQANWEWLLLAAGIHIDFPTVAIYRPIHSESFDQFMLRVRSRFGTELVPAKQAFMRLLQERQSAKVVVAVADQSPVEGDEKYWVHCLNQDTPFAVGMEKMARLLKYPVVFVGLRRVKRGYYEAEFTPIAVPPYTKDGLPITQRFSELFVEQLVQSPGDWLWTNRRWKYKKPVYS